MRTISYGKERPVAVCDDISCWSQNRRAVTVLNGARRQLSRAQATARGAARLEIDRREAYGLVESKAIRNSPVTSSFRPSLIAALAACLALAAPAQAQFDIFHRQAPPPADIPGAAAGSDEAAGLVVRINRLEEELRQANGRIEELENAQHRLEAQLQKFRQDVEFRFGDRSAGAPPEPDVAEAPLAPPQPTAPLPRPRRSDAFDPNADPNAPGAPRPLGTTAPSAPLVRESPAMRDARGRPAARTRQGGRRPPPQPRAGRRSSAPAWRCSISRASSSTPRCRPFRPGNIRRRKPGSRRFSPPIRRIA